MFILLRLYRAFVSCVCTVHLYRASTYPPPPARPLPRTQNRPPTPPPPRARAAAHAVNHPEARAPYPAAAAAAAERAAAGLPGTGFVFCCFNSLYKVRENMGVMMGFGN